MPKLHALNARRSLGSGSIPKTFMKLLSVRIVKRLSIVIPAIIPGPNGRGAETIVESPVNEPLGSGGSPCFF